MYTGLFNQRIGYRLPGQIGFKSRIYELLGFVGNGVEGPSFFFTEEMYRQLSLLFSLKQEPDEHNADFRKRIRKQREFFMSSEAYLAHEFGIIACAYSYALDYGTLVPSDESKNSKKIKAEAIRFAQQGMARGSHLAHLIYACVLIREIATVREGYVELKRLCAAMNLNIEEEGVFITAADAKSFCTHEGFLLFNALVNNGVNISKVNTNFYKLWFSADLQDKPLLSELEEAIDFFENNLLYELSTEACLCCIKHRKNEPFVAFVNSLMGRSSTPNLRIKYISDLLDAGVTWDAIQKIPASLYKKTYDEALKFFATPAGIRVLTRFSFKEIFAMTNMQRLCCDDFSVKASLSRDASPFYETLFLHPCFLERKHAEEFFKLLRVMFDSPQVIRAHSIIDQGIQFYHFGNHIMPLALFRIYFEHYTKINQAAPRAVKSYQEKINFERTWKNILQQSTADDPQDGKKKINLATYIKLVFKLQDDMEKEAMEICGAASDTKLASDTESSAEHFNKRRCLGSK